MALVDYPIIEFFISVDIWKELGTERFVRGSVDRGGWGNIGAQGNEGG